MRPRVIIHNAVSLDGRITGFEVDMRRYYALASTWKEDATLCGSGTILAAPEGRVREKDECEPRRKPDPGDRRPLLVVADSRGRVRCWSMLLGAGFWRDGVALCSRRTPARHIEYLRRRGVSRIVTDGSRVDLRRALVRLQTRYKVRTIRVDSGGTLNAALLRAGMVDELSLLVHPALAGTLARPLFAGAKPQNRSFRLLSQARLPGGLVWLRMLAVGDGRRALTRWSPG
jgi:2,5-diamino-6-(ribosylamino)-4(3H)-pyrimidinone 5'-phosphate reductase